jgi:hypothetical protein
MPIDAAAKTPLLKIISPLLNQADYGGQLYNRVQ